MFHINIKLAGFDGSGNGVELAEALDLLCSAMTGINMAWLLRHPETPSLFSSGVYYKPEPRGKRCKRESCEDFLDIPGILLQGHADCEDLACWLAAELGVQGIPAVPNITWQTVGDVTEYHVTVATPEGVIDPSELLGMNNYDRNGNVVR